MSSQSSLQILAGSRALAILRDEGLRPERVRVLAGAAGGPKWLVLSPLDRAIFGGFLPPKNEAPVHLIGSSIGSWRFAALAQTDWETRHRALEHAYIHQRYHGRPTANEVSTHIRTVVDAAVPDGAVEELLSQRTFALHFATVRGMGLLNRQDDVLFRVGLGAAGLGNVAHRNLLDAFFRRTYFHGHVVPPFTKAAGFWLDEVPLTSENFKSAMLASGSIPMLLEGVQPIAGAPAGVYWDGGIIDYHMDLPYDVKDDELILYPHFLPKIIPGWLDKFLPWRKASPERLKNVVLLAPTAEFVRNLPLRKIPDRTDFKRFMGRDDERIDAWEKTVMQSERLADEFMTFVTSSGTGKNVKALV